MSDEVIVYLMVYNDNEVKPRKVTMEDVIDIRDMKCYIL